MPKIEMTRNEWLAEGERRFGIDKMDWRFVCPSCGTVMSVRDYYNVGADGGMVAFSCIGRLMGVERQVGDRNGKGPCNYAGGGLFQLNPVKITDSGGGSVFAFAEIDDGND